MAIKKFWNSDKVTSLSAMLISLTTLIVFVYQTNLMRQQQYLSVMPYLSIGNEGSGSGDYRLVMYNDGLGPAFIESTTITYNGEKYDMDIPTFLSEFVESMDTINFTYSNIYPGKIIKAGEKINIIEFNNDVKGANAFFQVMAGDEIEADFELIYQSIYKERWKLDGETIKPQKLPRKRGSGF